MFRLPRPLLCSDFLDLCFDFLGQNLVRFVFFARPMFRLSQSKFGMFRIYRPMIRLPRPLFDFLDSYFFVLLTKVGYVSSFLLDLCFDLLNKNRVCFDFINQCFDFLDHCFVFLDLCFDFLGQNPVCFIFCARPIFRLLQPNSGMFRLYRSVFQFP